MDPASPARRAVLAAAACLLTRPFGGKSAAAAPMVADAAAMAAVVPPAPVPATVAWRAYQAGGPADGVLRTLADERGHAVLLNVWATWCGPCVAEMPSLARLAPAAAAAGIVVRPVSIDHGGADAVRAFFARAGVAGALPVLVDADGRVRDGLGVGAVPVSFLLDARGMIRGRLEAAANWAAPDALGRLRTLLG